MKSTFYTLCAILFFTFSANANILLDPPTAVKLIEKDFPLFKDKDSRVIYVDFELLSSNVTELKIVEKNGDIALHVDVSSEEVNAIYEVDYTKYVPGNYKLELHTYTGKVLNSSFIIE
jgi:hypothetical protein